MGSGDGAYTSSLERYFGKDNLRYFRDDDKRDEQMRELTILNKNGVVVKRSGEDIG